jgi:hypothetical protein
MFDDLRVATYKFIDDFYKQANVTVKGGAADKLTKGIWFAGLIAGSALFIGSFGCFLAPFLANWSWSQTLILFTIMQFGSGVLFNLRQRWIAVAATFEMIIDTFRTDKRF